MPIDIPVELDVMCGDCHAVLSADYSVGELYVQPCLSCLEKSFDEGWNEGYQAGIAESTDTSEESGQ